jgi:hypothetical protein
VTLVDRIVGAAGDILVVLLLVLAVLRVAWLAVRAGRRRQLVVQALTNLTGYPKLDADAAGLTQRIRDTLLPQLRAVHARARHLLHRADIEAGKDDLAPASSEIEVSLRELSASVTAVASDRIRPIAQLISDLIQRPAGTRVRGSLLRYGEHRRLGVGFEVIDLRGERRPATFSLWSKDNSLTEDSVKEAKAQTLVQVAARALAIELLRLDLLRRQRLWSWRGSRNPGVVSRFVGLIYQASALSYRDYGPQLYALAVDSLRDAAGHLPDDYQPQKDLGDTYSYWQRCDPEQGQHLAHALTAYDRAEEIARRTNAGDVARLSVRIGRALALFKAETQLDVARAEARKLLASLNKSWDLKAERDEFLLYNAACLLALELAQPDCDADARRQLWSGSVRLLGYALKRDKSPDRTVYETAETDSDLEGLRKLGLDTVAVVRKYREQGRL